MKLDLASRARRPTAVDRFIPALAVAPVVLVLLLAVLGVAVVSSYSSGVRTGHWSRYPEGGARVYELNGRKYRELSDGTLVPHP